MTESLLFHHPDCSKSRAAVELLAQHGLRPRLLAYLETPPTVAEIEALLRLLAIAPRELMRRDEPEYAALGLEETTLTHDELVAALAANPRLIQRPILIHRGRAAIGRPVERLLDLL
ncbi:arsenate reductase (glutaredoxin) [Arenimonas oryziterrae]|uniref:Arsenate reductase n=1 Tax=Arenimonas oryziterrae DSM 21050 = YC6267 TaxID=1121015 RepID=A0A091AU79_9GAMM|nr:arsenate reductase (glutaredoxin) [Arenimonas oryziterrae]KFN42911.1 hypothetical protein N789_12355 [Arenimonas oryziterrae DSM 21050 = YC6267]